MMLRNRQLLSEVNVPLVLTFVAVGGLTFQAWKNPVTQAGQLIAQEVRQISQRPDKGLNEDELFKGGAESLVAIAIGSAEGTRTPDGRKTKAYYGHRDPGNGVWNLGSFSFQHGAPSPEAADEKQLRVLRRQSQEVQRLARVHGVKLTDELLLQFLDLANQAPKAALARGGVVEKMAEANRMGMRGEQAIVWARTHSYIDPDTGSLDAPGLGGMPQVGADQLRRSQAVTSARQHYLSKKEAKS